MMKTRNELIEWLRQTDCTTVMAEATHLLAHGTPADELWAASVLTSCRYVNNQAHNLLGFVSHAMIGAEDARRLAVGQTPRTATLLLLQSIYQTVMDLHDPSFAPYELLPFWPYAEPTSAETMRQLRADIHFGEYSRADHRFIGLAEQVDRATLIDFLLDIGLEGITTDDHTLISPVLSLGLLELVGWEAGFDLLRWSIRYCASFPLNRTPYERAVGLIQHYGLANGAAATALQPERIQPLRHLLFTATAHERPELIARALAEQGCSPLTAVTAAAQTACDMYLRVDPVPHADFDAISREVAPIHIGNALRLLREGLGYLSPATQALAAVQAGSLIARGPSVLNQTFQFVDFEPVRAYPYAEDVAHWHEQPAERILASLRAACRDHDCRQVTALVHSYGAQSAPPQALIATLTEIAATDNGTLLHNFKHLNSMVREFQASDHTDRWDYLIQAAKFASWYTGLTTQGYERAEAALADHLPAL